MTFEPFLENLMLQALGLALKARGQTAPNPMVGALVVNSHGEVIGRGFHPKAGEPHAEVFAIREAQKNLENLSECQLFVTLEPCNHFGKTPPCADFIISSGIKEVFVGSIDPNPLMQGKSIDKLREAGIRVKVGVAKNETDKMIRGFKSVMNQNRPFVSLKCATSLDGKIATASGESKWITGDLSRKIAHRERSEHDAILVGVGTILSDDPSLSVRGIEGYKGSLKKIILDSRLRTPPQAKLFLTPGPVIIYCDKNYSSQRKLHLEAAGALIVPVEKNEEGGLSLHGVLKDLAQNQKVQDILVEGGAKVLSSFIQFNLFDRLLYFIAPKILGSEGLDVFEGLKIKSLQESPVLQNFKSQTIGPDILIEGTREGGEACSPV